MWKIRLIDTALRASWFLTIGILVVVCGPRSYASTDISQAETAGIELSHYDDVPAALAAGGWKQLRVKRRPVATFAPAADNAIAVSANQGAGFLYRPMSEFEATADALSWTWRVDVAPEPTSLSQRGQDDRPLAVHVWFPIEFATASLWTVLRTGIGKLLDLPVPGKILTYVWGGSEPRGSSLANPYLVEDGRIIVLRPGHSSTAGWVHESVDFRADFERAFGYPAPPASFLVISADMDDLQGFSKAAIRNIRFDE